MRDSLNQIIQGDEPTAKKLKRAAESIRNARGYRWGGLYEVTPKEIVAIAWTGKTAPVRRPGPPQPVQSEERGKAGAS